MNKVSTKTINLKGGLDIASPHLNISPGMVIEALNFEATITGGYRRIDGYERTAGGEPIDYKPWYSLRVSDAALFANTDLPSLLTNADTLATAVIVAVDLDDNRVCITNMTGVFSTGDSLIGYPGVTVASVPVLNSTSTAPLRNVWKLAAANYWRNRILPVPGDGPVLGVWVYKGDFYAFRKNGAGDKVVMYKGTGDAWQAVPFYSILPFKTGVMTDQVTDLTEGDTITGATSGATGVIKRFVKNSGSFGTDAAGYFVVAISTVQDFALNEAVQKGGVTKCTAAADSYAITFTPGNNVFKFIGYNFRASSDTFHMYGCDGVNPAFEFDGEVLSPILLPGMSNAPLSNDPKYLAAHNNYLWLAFSHGSLQNSTLGEPLVFNGFLGAAEYGMGDEITGLVSVLDTALIVTTRSDIRKFTGRTTADFQQSLVANNTGCIDGTTINAVRPLVLTQKGLIRLDATQNYGNFQSVALSRFIWPLFQEALKSKTVLAAGISRLKNQYKVYFTDGTGVIMTQDALYADQSMPSFSTFAYVDKPTCISSAEVSDTQEVLLFGAADGYVYRENTGCSFDGEPIIYALRTPFMHLGSPSVRKAFKRAEFDLTSDGGSDIRFSYELSYGQTHTERSHIENASIYGLGGYWDVAKYSEASWSSPIVAQQINSLTGTGHNISMLFYGNSATTDSFSLDTITLHYLMRRLNRG